MLPSMGSIHLFCLPFAGGNKYSYRDYEAKAPPFLKVTPLEYPGRGSRAQERLLFSMEEIVEDLYRQIKDIVNGEKYAIYGHSMGGIVCFLLTRKLMQHNHTPPLHVFITGAMGPSATSRSDKGRHLMGKEKFINEVKNMDGIPEEVLAHEELLDYFEPILRADFMVTETYIYTDARPLPIPFTVITGTEEKMDPADIRLWQKETTLPVDFRKIPGKHFFIFRNGLDIVKIISEKLFIHNNISHG